MIAPPSKAEPSPTGETQFRRLGKGYIRWIILALLAEQPRTGYELQQAIAKALEGWRPSPGTLYPILHDLRQKGLVKGLPQEREGRHRITYDIQSEGLQKLEATANDHVLFVAALHKLLGKHGAFHPMRPPTIDIDHILPRIHKRTKVFLDEVHLLPKGLAAGKSTLLLQNRLDFLKEQSKWFQAAIARVQAQLRKYERRVASKRSTLKEVHND